MVNNNIYRKSCKQNSTNFSRRTRTFFHHTVFALVAKTPRLYRSNKYILDDRDSLEGQTGLFIRTYKRNQRPGEVNHPFKSRVSPGYCMQIGIAVE